jgi:hypothetical protein
MDGTTEKLEAKKLPENVAESRLPKRSEGVQALLGVFFVAQTRLLQKDTTINKLGNFVILLCPV